MNDTQNRFYEPLGNNILFEHEEQTRQLGNDEESNHFVHLPDHLNNLRDVSDPSKVTDTPVFWHVSKSGGTTMVDIFSACFGFVVAAEIGVLEGHGEDESIAVVDLNEGLRYVNVDTTTIPGLHRAAQLGLAPSHLSDIIVTPFFNDAAGIIFNEGNKGRMFTIFRHPIDRAVSMFYYLQKAEWETTYDPALKDMSVEEYALSGKAEENWMTRFLVNKLEGPLSTEDIILSREILRRKFLIGLLSFMEESVARFERYFNWNVQSPDMQECVGKVWTNKQQHPKLEIGSPAWNALITINNYDMELYMYAEELFQQQGQIFLAEN